MEGKTHGKANLCEAIMKRPPTTEKERLRSPGEQAEEVLEKSTSQNKGAAGGGKGQPVQRKRCDRGGVKPPAQI